MKKILIGTSVRQSEEVFKYYLDSLDKLIKPDGYEIHRLFCLHNSEHLRPILENHPCYKKTLDFIVHNDDISYTKDEVTHNWNNGAVDAITNIKNFILDYARYNGYEYMFFVDSDLILQPETLVSLVEAKKDIIAEIFWTKWTPDEPESPNAWDYDGYTFGIETSDNDEFERITSLPFDKQSEYAKQLKFEQWHTKGIYKVGMSGACILLNRKVLDCVNINYNKVKNISLWGEDRHFCIRAASHDFEIWIDTNYPATHLYRDSELEQYRKVVNDNGML